MSVNKNDLRLLADDVMNAFAPHYQWEMGAVIAEVGVPGGFYILFLARSVDPDPLTVDVMEAHVPYATRDWQAQRLETVAEGGYLEHLGEGAYRLSPKGREIIERCFRVGHDFIGQTVFLPQTDMERLADLLQRVVQATEQATEPAEKPALLASRWTDDGATSPVSVRIDQYLTDIHRYRDDAHVAAWKQHDIAGYEWEAFSFVWSGDASTAAEIHELRPFRGYTVEDYQSALQALVSRGWLQEANGGFHVTDEGKRIRDAAESLTDRYFFVGFDSLSETELDELRSLLERGLANLRRMTAEKTYGIINETRTLFFQIIQDDRAQVAQELGLTPIDWYSLYVALSHGGMISTEIAAQRTPYASTSALEERFQKGVEASGLAAIGDGKYRLTDEGHQALQRILKSVYDGFAKAETLPEEALQQYLDMLDRLTNHILQGDWYSFILGATRSLDPAESVDLLSRIDQRYDEIGFYRDDAHVAAWKEVEQHGGIWETFSYVWSGECNTVAAIAEHLTPVRGYSADDYAEFLDELMERGWIQRVGDHFEVTAKGRQLRENVEAVTDDNFYGPWSVFDVNELTQFYILTRRLRDATRDYFYDQLTAKNQELRELLLNSIRQLYPLYGPVLRPVLEETKLDAPGALFMLHLASRVHPEPLTTAFVHQLYPYGSQSKYRSQIDGLVEAGYLEAASGGFRFTEAGQAAYDQLNRGFYDELARIGDRLTVDMVRTVELLNKVVEAMVKAPEPEPTAALESSRRIHPGIDVHGLVQIDAANDDLGAFRDDCHIAAWREYNVDGYVWETFSNVWEGEHNTAATLGERYAFRGYTEADYADALAQLVGRGWVVENESVFVLTDEGRALRERAEMATNRYFYAPWVVLNKEEREELHGLLNQLSDELTALREAAEKQAAAAQ